MPLERSKSHGNHNNDKNNRVPHIPQKCPHQHDGQQAFATCLIAVIVNTLNDKDESWYIPWLSSY